MLLYNSEILLVNYLEVQYLTHIKFQEDLKILTNNDLKSEFFMLFDKMVKRKARLILFDVSKIQHLVDKEFQTWISRTIFPLIISMEAKKIAWLFNSDKNFIIDFDNFAVEKVQQKQFSYSADAMKWLMLDAKRKKLRFD